MPGARHSISQVPYHGSVSLVVSLCSASPSDSGVHSAALSRGIHDVSFQDLLGQTDARDDPTGQWLMANLATTLLHVAIFDQRLRLTTIQARGANPSTRPISRLVVTFEQKSPWLPGYTGAAPLQLLCRMTLVKRAGPPLDMLQWHLAGIEQNQGLVWRSIPTTNANHTEWKAALALRALRHLVSVPLLKGYSPLLMRESRTACFSISTMLHPSVRAYQHGCSGASQTSTPTQRSHLPRATHTQARSCCPRHPTRRTNPTKCGLRAGRRLCAFT